ncbi:MAG: hypothetical protein ACREMG_00385 [Gemmatimonadales bacterium]
MTDDWFDALMALLDADVRFLVVGAHAMALHGVPRGTQDLDLWIDPAPDNAARVWQALATFGAPLAALGVTPADFSTPETVIQLGLPPNRIDILTGLSGIPDFAPAWATREEHPVRGRAVPFLGRAMLLANKRAAGRPKDRADLDALEG